MTFFLNSVDSKALKRLDGRMLLRLQDLRKEVEMNCFVLHCLVEKTFYPAVAEQFSHACHFQTVRSPVILLTFIETLFC